MNLIDEVTLLLFYTTTLLSLQIAFLPTLDKIWRNASTKRKPGVFAIGALPFSRMTIFSIWVCAISIVFTVASFALGKYFPCWCLSFFEVNLKHLWALGIFATLTSAYGFTQWIGYYPQK